MNDSYRLLRGDLIETFKLCHKYYNIGQEEILPFNTNILQGHNFKLEQNIFNKIVQRWGFSNHIVQEWDNLPQEVLTADSTNPFMKNTDKFFIESKFL